MTATLKSTYKYLLALVAAGYVLGLLVTVADGANIGAWTARFFLVQVVAAPVAIYFLWFLDRRVTEVLGADAEDDEDDGPDQECLLVELTDAQNQAINRTIQVVVDRIATVASYSYNGAAGDLLAWSQALDHLRRQADHLVEEAPATAVDNLVSLVGKPKDAP